MRCAYALASMLLLARALAEDYDPAYSDGSFLDFAIDEELQDPSALTDEFTYGIDALDTEYGGHGEDSYHYYGDEYDEYYDTYGFYGDNFGDDYFFKQDERLQGDCDETAAGKANLTQAACPIIISGVDKSADLLPGGIDGKYVVNGCWDGRPKYKRSGNKTGGDRTMWYSQLFNDWDISIGADVNSSMESIVMYGGDGQTQTRPNFVSPDRWHLLAHYSSQTTNSDTVADYMPVTVNMTCADGKKIQRPDLPVGPSHSLLTDEESDASYRAIYTRHQVNSSEPTINFSMVVLMVVLGVGVVMGIPYMMFKPASGQADGKSFAQMLEEARKKRAGHVL